VPRRRRQVVAPRLPDEAGEPEKRRAILHAAVRVFARKGYHGCRIADVARQAGVAYGLVYHYFRSKEELLESVFAEQWTIFIQAIRAIREGPGSAVEHLAAVCRFAMDVFRTAPDAVRVLILEVPRTPHGLRAGGTRRTFEAALRLIADEVRRGQEAGELRRGVDPLVAAAAILGSLELNLTAMVVGVLARPPASEEELERITRQVVDVSLGGVLPRGRGGTAG
jgi:TetR/AcrR family fatty acid metabolism transcriptional regulator